MDLQSFVAAVSAAYKQLPKSLSFDNLEAEVWDEDFQCFVELHAFDQIKGNPKLFVNFAVQDPETLSQQGSVQSSILGPVLTRLDYMTTKMESMATKQDMESMATKQDMEELKASLQDDNTGSAILSDLADEFEEEARRNLLKRLRSMMSKHMLALPGASDNVKFLQRMLGPHEMDFLTHICAKDLAVTPVPCNDFQLINGTLNSWVASMTQNKNWCRLSPTPNEDGVEATHYILCEIKSSFGTRSRKTRFEQLEKQIRVLIQHVQKSSKDATALDIIALAGIGVPYNDKSATTTKLAGYVGSQLSLFPNCYTLMSASRLFVFRQETMAYRVANVERAQAKASMEEKLKASEAPSVAPPSEARHSDAPPPEGKVTRKDPPSVRTKRRGGQKRK